MLRFILAPLLLGSSVTDGGQIALEEYIKRLQLSGIVCHVLLTANFYCLDLRNTSVGFRACK